jgi:glycosyltransferase involved in cell wall biosynthesis
VIVPTHNRPDLLREALESLRSQAFAGWEAIVVDDASTPAASLDVEDPRIRIVRHATAQGGAAAKNTGIANARGNLLAFLDDDDCYDRRYLERAVDILDRHPELDVLFMGVTWFGSNGAWGQRNYDDAMAKFMAAASGETSSTLTIFGDALLPALLKSVPMALQRPVVRRTALERIGTYRPDCLLWDCDWAIQAALHGRTALLNEGLYRQRADGQGYSSKRDRTVEQLQSGIDIKDRLWRKSRKGTYAEHSAGFRRAAADAWFDLAWHHYLHGSRKRALMPLLQSARRFPRFDHLKLLVRLAVPLARPAKAAQN